MSTYQIVEARRHMCGKMARQLRLEHQQAAIRVGAEVHRGLRDVYASSFYRKAWLVDGHLTALFGVAGSIMSPCAFVWLATTERVQQHPVAFVKECRAQMRTIARMGKTELATTIIDGDDAAKRLVVFLGWHVTDTGAGAAAETRYGRKTLIDYIDHEPRIRIPMGAGHAIKLGWHEPYPIPGEV